MLESDVLIRNIVRIAEADSHQRGGKGEVGAVGGLTPSAPGARKE